MVDVTFNYDLLIEKINDSYEGSSLSVKITKFCKDVKIKLNRFKMIISNRAYFQTNEIIKIKKILNIEEVSTFFFNQL